MAPVHRIVGIVFQGLYERRLEFADRDGNAIIDDLIDSGEDVRQ
jgi:hypothetical protein